MKRLVICLLLSACAATGAPRTPAERVAGCWINRDVGAVTMRWLPDAARPGAMVGSKLAYRQSGAPVSTRYALEPSGEGWALCELAPDANTATRCWQVAQGQSGSLEGGRAFIDAHADRLRISIIGDGDDRLIFHGRRDGCD